jgi:hypothetical protein
MKAPFRLRQSVKNPSPDRRHVQTVWAMEEWKEGSIWVLTKGSGNAGDRLELRGAHGRIDEEDERFALLRESMEPIKLLEFGDGHTDESGDSFRSFMAMSESSARSILANLYFVGTASMEDLKVADKEVLDLDEEVYESFYT